MRRPVLFLLVLALGASPSLTGAEPAPGAARRFSVDSPFVRDRFGRALFFHGVNMVWKRPPYYPPSRIYRRGAVSGKKSYLDGRDAAFLARNGLRSVRLGVLWAGVEPRDDRWDEDYLDRMAEIVRLLGRRGITVLVDFHQDLYNERFQGEGFPEWATHNDAPPTNCCGFPGNYFTPAVMQAFDNLWLNRFDLWDEFREFWVHVARRFRDEPNVIGYDLLNEPWPGSQWPTCANPAGCPAFDSRFMQPFYEHAIEGIRRVDPDAIVWWEPNVTNDFGAANGVGTAAPLRDPSGNQGISFHDYCLLGGGFAPGLSRADDPECPLAEDLTFQRQREAAERNGAALFLTEFGASDDLVDIGRVLALADRYLVSWHYWHYGSWADPTGNPAEEGMFRDDLDRPGSLKDDKADLLIRTHPQAVAGDPASFSFDPVTKDFTLSFEADPRIPYPTLVFVPVKRHYGDHYRVKVDGPARVVSGRDAPVLRLRNTGRGLVTVRVTVA